MSGLEIAAAAIGITDVAVKSIKAVYDFCQAIQAAEGKVADIKSDITALMRCADGLDFLKTASDGVKGQDPGTGTEGLLGRMREVVQGVKRRDEGYILVGMGSASEAQKKAQAEQLQRDIEAISREAQQQQERAALLAAELEEQNQEEYDDDRDSQLRQVNGEVAAHQLLLANCAVASDDLKQLAIVSVKVKDVYAEGVGSSNAAGVSKDAIDKLKEARVEAGKMTAKGGGKNQIGIL
nr:hypothetical protein B0A51_00444 [Rachicladosporium sp. CCFEE 5018]